MTPGWQPGVGGTWVAAARGYALEGAGLHQSRRLCAWPEQTTGVTGQRAELSGGHRGGHPAPQEQSPHRVLGSVQRLQSHRLHWSCRRPARCLGKVEGAAGPRGPSWLVSQMSDVKSPGCSQLGGSISTRPGEGSTEAASHVGEGVSTAPGLCWVLLGTELQS